MKASVSKNVSNFETMVIILTELGEAWNPSQPLIRLDALRAQSADLRTLETAYARAVGERANAINRRQEAFRDFPKLLVRIQRIVTVTLNDDEVAADIAAVVRLTRSRRATAVPTAANGNAEGAPSVPASNRTVGHSGFDERIALLARVIELIRPHAAEYVPNDAALQLDALEARIESMRAAHSDAKAASATVDQHLQSRRARLGDPATGVLRIFKLVKDQLMASFGNENVAYRRVIRLRFAA
jgi:preprotein translocase subunit SecA